MASSTNQRPNDIVNEVVNTGGKWVRPQKVVIPPLFGNESYLVRYVLFRTPWFGAYIHRIDSPDGERHPHNHPRVFWSLILRGGYTETVCYKDRWGGMGHRTWRFGSIHKMPLYLFHGIAKLLRTPTWTLLLVGPKRQEWGFATEDGFIDALAYKSFIEQRRVTDAQASLAKKLAQWDAGHIDQLAAETLPVAEQLGKVPDGE